MMHYGNGVGTGSWVMMIVLFILFFGALIAWIAMMDHNESPALHPYNPRTATSARRILEERFARGEINEDEYMRRVETLKDTER